MFRFKKASSSFLLVLKNSTISLCLRQFVNLSSQNSPISISTISLNFKKSSHSIWKLLQLFHHLRRNITFHLEVFCIYLYIMVSFVHILSNWYIHGICEKEACPHQMWIQCLFVKKTQKVVQKKFCSKTEFLWKSSSMQFMWVRFHLQWDYIEWPDISHFRA